MGSLIDSVVEGRDPIGKRPIEFGPREMKEGHLCDRVVKHDTGVDRGHMVFGRRCR